MVALYAQSPASDGYRNLVAGYYMSSNLVNTGMIDARQLIYDDYDLIHTGSLSAIALAAVYCPILFIVDYSSVRVQVYGGNPVRSKYGTLTSQHVNLYGYKEFITYDKQIFKNKMCLVNVPPVDFPPSMSALPPLETFSFFSLSSWRFNATTPGFWNEWFSSDKIVYDLEPTVIATIGFYYVCYRCFPGSIPPSWTVGGI